MILPYALRLVCLCLAAFFLVHFVLGLAAAILGPYAIRLAARLRPITAARLLLGLRLLPLAGSIFVVAGLCVPSFLWLEPEAAAEEVGLLCSTAGFLALAQWWISIARSLRAMTRSLRYVDGCLRSGRKTYIAGEVSPVWILDGAGGGLFLAGILHPRIILSRPVMQALSPGELSAALGHERAHQTSRDNFKRLLLLLSPDVLPFWRCFDELEREWSKFAEWAADDGAVGGDPDRSLSLAAALVQVARLGPERHATPLVTCLVADGADLAARVNRLLCCAPSREEARPAARVAAGATVVALAAAVASAMMQPRTLYIAHQMLERLID